MDHSPISCSLCDAVALYHLGSTGYCKKHYSTAEKDTRNWWLRSRIKAEIGREMSLRNAARFHNSAGLRNRPRPTKGQEFEAHHDGDRPAMPWPKKR